MRFSKRKLHFLFFSFLCWKSRNRKKEKKKKNMEKAKNTIKNRFFKVVIQKCEQKQKRIFSKTCLTLFVSGREKNAHFRAHYLFWPKMFFGPKQCKSGKTIKIVVSPEIVQNQKWHLFFEKGVFWHGWKTGFYWLCFWKAVLFWKHYFYSVFSKTQLFKSKNGMSKKTKNLWNIVGCFWFLNMAKWCFLGLFFLRF